MIIGYLFTSSGSPSGGPGIRLLTGLADLPRLSALSMIGALCAVLLGCISPSDDYFPLQPGMTWLYQLDVTDMDGTTRQQHMLQAAAARELDGEMLPVRRTADGTWLYYRQTSNGLLLAAHQRPDHDLPQAVQENRQLLLPAVLQPGSSWSVETETIALARTGPPQRSEYRIIAPLRMQYTIEATDDTVTVPAGRFHNCLRVHGTGLRRQFDAGNYIGRTDITIEKTDWYAPGVGLVKSVRRESTDKTIFSSNNQSRLFAGDIVMELTQFRKGWRSD